MAQHDDVLVAGLIEEQRGLCQQGVEPASRLIHRLGDELSRELLLEQILVFKGIVVLGKGHGSGVEPAVDHLRHPVHGAAALRTLHCDLVDVGTMKLHGLRPLVAAQLIELFAASDGMLMAAALALPHIQRSSPVAVAADAPVLDILQPVAEAALADALRDPVDGVVIADEVLLHRRHLDEPGFPGVIDERGVAAPAERVVMLKLRRGEQLSFLIQIL